MSDSSEGSLLDSIIAGVIIFYFLLALIILYPLAPGGIIGFEISKVLTDNSDIHKVSIIVGMVVNFFVYMGVARAFYLDVHSLGTKIYLYLFSTGVLVLLNTFVENKLLQTFNIKLKETILFFLDFDRWFVDNAFANGLLIVLYGYVSFWIIAFLYGLFFGEPKRRGPKKYI
ncbi:putative membrane protein [Sulfurimonas gotlandica GD1]|uniref:Putative membrane protein n=1 Tax=Sulfurimonas gotlandica (strain DSM 19862 / JCM 16533 / GD1) TaxID=929558 RepID=B6BP10_SULGG|nr:hypothetical protein [Sulfurimonas gotlandica]EDZ61158.1 hypothetical protein CBGD1_1515 [Sulfurimonas gotlandica GD1]EHP29211.1 putative membrane protein [Sulfurimonas gotlandica GD1]